MGGCLSRKKASPLNAAGPVSVAAMEAVGPGKLCETSSVKGEPDFQIKEKLVGEEKVKKQVAAEEEAGLVKKDVVMIKHRKSHDREKPSPPPQKDVVLADENMVAPAIPSCTSVNASADVVEMGSNAVVRTSSCTKEELDAILIQCGRLSRSNSSGAGKAASSGRKYSGRKRSYDLDHNDQDQDLEVAPAANYDAKKRGSDSKCNDGDDDETSSERRQHRQRHRQRHSGRTSPSPSSQGRRRTPSREREQRSGSRERGSGSSSSGRRVSQSPGRRSETTPTANSTGARPGKMVSVPATVSSLTMDRSNICEESQTATAIKRISVKKNVGDAALAASRGAASPRSQSPARANAKGSNENNQQPSLSRSSSRKAEHSPYRRNPLSEIDPNSLVYAQATGNNKTACINNSNSGSRVQTRNKEIEVQAAVKESINVLNQIHLNFF